jgi:hypothetical protein
MYSCAIGGMPFRKYRAIVGTPFDDRGAIFSPNGRWVAYVSNKSGGKRFVMVEEPQAMAATQIARVEVNLNWLDELKRRVPSRMTLESKKI